jgi:hypothetical protein
MLYAGIGVGISAVLFFTIHSFAKPPPRTMTKEWQEATNEYLRVSQPTRLKKGMLMCYSPRIPIPSTVSQVKVTAAKVMYRANRPKHKASAWRRKNRSWFGEGCMCLCSCRRALSKPVLCTLASNIRDHGRFLYCE